MCSAPSPIAGRCAHCGAECARWTGRDIWPGRPDLHGKVMWGCAACDAWCGSHPNDKPLGTAANAALRRARTILHSRLDPIWKDAPSHPKYDDLDRMSDKDRAKSIAIIRRVARVRTYRFIADRLGITKDEMHVAMFDIDRCRAAWKATYGVTYDDVRKWHYASKAVP